MEQFHVKKILSVRAEGLAYALPLLLALIFLSCTEESDAEFEKQTFISVFDQREFSSAYYPIDLRQTVDGGYLVLAERKMPASAFRGTYLLKVDKFGNFVTDLPLDQYANPVGDLMEVNGSFYFFAMDTLTLQGKLLKADASAQNVELVANASLSFPHAATLEGKYFLVLGYNHLDKTSVVALYDTTGGIVKGPVNFSIGTGDDVEEPIMTHIMGTGKRFPFQVGKVSDDVYFFNGFQNYSFSVVFTALDPEAPAIGVIHGQQDDSGLSAILPLAGGVFAASRFDFGANYFLPRANLQTHGPSTGAYLGGFELPELVPDARVKILQTSVGTSRVLIFASDTRSKQIGLFFYDEITGDFISSRYLGFSNPFEFGAIIATDDGGIAISGTTWLAGRFPRICLFKVSKTELSNQVN